jgi:energy-coupling factor transport system permease protein
MTIGQYYPGNSVVHKMDPRMKLILTIAFIVIIFVCKNFWSLLVMILGLALMTFLSKVPVKLIFRGIKPIIVIIIITAVLNIFYTDTGTLLWKWANLRVTTGGLYTAAFMAVRIMCLIVGSSLLTYTTSPTSITDGIETLLSPLKFMRSSVHTLAMMMTIALRFIPTLTDEFEKITAAQKARGADLESGNFIKRSKALIPVFIPLFVTSFRRAYELAFAMECRCYKGGEGRTRMKQLKYRMRDGAGFVLMAAVYAGVIILNKQFPAVI